MGFFDTILGVPSKPPKKKKHGDDGHRSHRRKDPADDHTEDAREHSARSKDPANEEELRAARLNYLSKTPEQRSRDVARAQREAHLRSFATTPDASHAHDKKRESTKAASRHASASKSKSSKPDAEPRRRQDRDEDGYQYVYGPPPAATASPATNSRDASRRSSTVPQKPAPRRDSKTAQRSVGSLSDESQHHRTRAHVPDTKRSGYAVGHEQHASRFNDRPAGDGSGLRRQSRSVTGSQVKKSRTVLVKDDDNISVSSRPTLQRSQTTSHAHAPERPKARRRSTRPIFEDDEEAPESQTPSSHGGMKAPILGTMPIRESEAPTSPTIDHPPALDRRKSEPPPQTTDCSICLDTIPITQKFDLSCSHTWCHSCLKRTFFISPTDGIITKPPQCCNTPVPLALAPAVLTPSELKIWNRKMREIAEKRPIYCLSKMCNGRWISPRCFFEDGRGRRFAQCTKCNGRVCLRCKAKLHEGRCKVDTGEKELLKVAEEQEWKQCPQCKILVERSEGCTHMTCRCGAEFCYKCGVPYIQGAKACGCPIIDRMRQPPGRDGRELDEDEAYARRLQLEMLMGLRNAAANAGPWDFFGNGPPQGQFGEQRHGHRRAPDHFDVLNAPPEPFFQPPMHQQHMRHFHNGVEVGGGHNDQRRHGMQRDGGDFAAAFIGGFVRGMRGEGWDD